jgi:hypothetical protein
MPVSNATGLPVALPPVLVAPLAGDYNGDGFVTMLDYETWKTNYGSTTHLAADGNGNRKVDAADYTVWRNLLSLGSGAISSSAQLPLHAVPEPASLALLLFGASLISIMRTRRPAIRTRQANRA